jgi:hypothetical protein
MTDGDRAALRAKEADDWATIRELLKAGCSLPGPLQKIYDDYTREMQQRMFGGMRRTKGLNLAASGPRD